MMKKTLRAAALTAAMTTMLSGAAFAMATVTDGQETSDGATLTYPVVKADAPEAQQRINMVIEDDVKAFMQEIDAARVAGKPPAAKMSYEITKQRRTAQPEDGAVHLRGKRGASDVLCSRLYLPSVRRQGAHSRRRTAAAGSKEAGRTLHAGVTEQTPR